MTIGMTDKKTDPNIREPFLWEKKDADKSRVKWIEPKHSTDETITPATEQARDPNSLLNFYRTLIALRNGSRALTFGTLEPLDVESLLVLHNVSATETRVPIKSHHQDYRALVFSHAGAGAKPDAWLLPPRSTLILRK